MQFIDLKAQYAALQEEINLGIQDVLSQGQYIMGQQVTELEEEISAFLNVKHVISCANGTDALKMLYMAYNIGKDDAVFCPDITFIASIEPACLLGATPVFCDITKDTFNLSPESLELQIKAVQKEGRLHPKAVVAVDFLGNPADYDALGSICKKYNLILIQDAAQSFGGEYQGKKCGGLGFPATTSFFPAKPLGCYGDGGAVMMDDDAIANICQSIRIHGKGTSKYDNVRIGLNSRLDTIQAAILLPKLNALKDYEMQARQDVANRYKNAFINHFTLPTIASGNTSAYAQYALLAKDTQQREKILEKLHAESIPSMVYYPSPQHTLPVFSKLNSYDETFDNARDYCARTFSIPMHPYLDQESQEHIIQTIQEAIE